MYYIQSYIDSGSFAYPAKKVDRSDWFYSLFDAIGKTNKDYVVPNLEKMIDEHDKTAEALN